MQVAQTVVLRSQLLVKIEGLDTLTSLTALELYDNAIAVVEGVEHLGRLRCVRAGLRVASAARRSRCVRH